MNPSLLPKITAKQWADKHAGHNKVQCEGLSEHNEREIVFLMSLCRDCQEIYLYDWVFRTKGDK